MEICAVHYRSPSRNRVGVSGGRFGWLVGRPTSISPLSDQRVVIGALRTVVPILVQEGAMSLRKDDWIVYAALLPALLALGGVGGVAAGAWQIRRPWHDSEAIHTGAPSEGMLEGL